MSGWGQGFSGMTCSHFGWMEKRRVKNMFQCNKISLGVSSQLFNEYHATSVWILAGVASLHLTYMWYASCKRRQIKLNYSHIKGPPLHLSVLRENIFFTSHHNRRSSCPFGLIVPFASQNFKFAWQMSDDGHWFAGLWVYTQSHLHHKLVLWVSILGMADGAKSRALFRGEGQKSQEVNDCNAFWSIFAARDLGIIVGGASLWIWNNIYVEINYYRYIWYIVLYVVLILQWFLF